MNSVQAPKVSVLIPTYNYGNYIGEAIDSILSQSLTDFELIVCEDCSGDNTAEVMAPYVEMDERVKYFENSSNLGMVNNWNHCLELARGEYIKYVFGDDLLCSDQCLEKMAKILDENPEVSLVASSRKIIGNDGERITSWKFFDLSGTHDGAEVIKRCLFDNMNYIGEPTAVMFRKGQAQRGYDLRYRQLVDLEMWLYLLNQNKFHYIDEELCAFRVHDKQQTFINAKTNVHQVEMLMLYKDYILSGRVKIKYLWRIFLIAHSKLTTLREIKKKRISAKEARVAFGDSFWWIGVLPLLPFYYIWRILFRFSGSTSKRFTLVTNRLTTNRKQ